MGSQDVLETKERLCSAPFTVLLPQLGDSALLRALKPAIERRLRELQDQVSLSAEDVAKELVAEMSMLAQVVKWVSSEDDES